MLHGPLHSARDAHDRLDFERKRWRHAKLMSCEHCELARSRPVKLKHVENRLGEYLEVECLVPINLTNDIALRSPRTRKLGQVV